MPFPRSGAAPVVSDGKYKSAEWGIEDFDTWKACIVLRESGWECETRAKVLGEL
jgi:hypothetical protein